MKASIFRGKTVLVTGGTGTIGSELVRQVLTYKPKQVRIFSRDDTRQYELRQTLPQNAPLRFLIGDVRDYARLEIAMRGVDIVLHAAALKHVPASEFNPYEAVKTNIIGSQNVIELAVIHRVRRVIAVSTDKAANPKNVLGTSKLMMEKLFINANYTHGLRSNKDGFTPTRFSCVRFGNVLWSRGSVLPVWKERAERLGEILITDPAMTRFMMSQTQAMALVLSAAELARGGEVFILKMPSISLGELAKLFIKKYYSGKKIRVVRGANRGREKLHEELFMSDDQGDVFENKAMLVHVPHLLIDLLKQPIFTYPGFKRRAPFTYSSRDNLNPKAIARML